MTAAYDHTQPGTVVVACLAAGAAITVLAGVFALNDPEAALVGGLIVGAVLLVLLACLAVFRCLRVVVTDEQVVVSFGWGWPKRTIPLESIREARAVRNSWIYGWGIRLIPSGWMFNVSGLDAVELELGAGRRFRIGTDDPAGLEAALRRAIELRRRAG